MNMSNVRRTFQIHTNSGPHSCPECGRELSVRPGMKIEDALNHMLGHGYQLLHVGSEWDRDDNGKSVSHTIAILGK